MPSINVDSSDKEAFDEMKPDDLTQKEFFSELIDAKKRDEGQIVDVSEIVDQVSKQTATSVELASYRGTRDALDSYLGHDE